MVSSATEVEEASSLRWHALLSNWQNLLQLILAIAVVYLYDIESPALPSIMTLAAVGFAVSLVAPRSYRLGLFVALSLAGILVVLGVRDGAFLIAFGLTLIGICRLRTPMIYRILILLAAAALLAAMRMRLINAGWSPGIWPVLGSMFMFRVVLYLRAIASKQVEHGFQHAIAYFFMLPNVAFPLFPVVDYRAFLQNHFDKDEKEIYERGLLWISRGLVHLVLYRFVYQNVLNPTTFDKLSDVVQWMLGTLLLYLRVSGQFHLIVGILHLFGFRLPETHKLYFLAHGFTELWRRMNIYWTEFMTNVVFYPAYYRVKRLGPIAALSLSTAAVFIVTWILHSYQWFWLQGGFPIRLQDVLFWGILGILVIRGAIKEQKAGNKTKVLARRWCWKNGVRAARTFFILCILWSLWSSGSVDQWLFNIGIAAVVDAKGVLLISLVFVGITILGAYHWRPLPAPEGKWSALIQQPVVRSTLGLVVLLGIAQPVSQEYMPKALAATVDSLRNADFNTRDLVRAGGYYEQLDDRGGVINEAMNDGVCRGEFWKAARREWESQLIYDYQPSLHYVLTCWGAPPRIFSTNSYGMRDKEYSLAKPNDTLRIAILGPSFAAGMGVSDGETFEQLVEERLNRDISCPEYRHFEILNFSVGGYSLPHEIAMLDDRVFQFSPDIVLMTVTMKTRWLTAYYLSNATAGDISIPYEPVNALLNEAGLENVAEGSVPIPFPTWRSIARRIGIEPRAPSGESYARSLGIAERVDQWALRRFAEVTTARGATPIILAIDQPEDDMSPAVPVRQMLRESGLAAIDLFDVYPVNNRHSLWAAPWDPHPNAAGHRVIADQLYKELIPILKSECPKAHAQNTSHVPTG